MDDEDVTRITRDPSGWTRAGVAAVVVVVLAAAGAVVLDGDGGEPGDGAPSTSASTTAAPGPDADADPWTRLPDAPAVDASRGAPGIVWTGSEFVVWGGGQQLATAYDPAGSSRRIADAPIPPRHDPVAVWTGSEAVFWGGTGAEGTGAEATGPRRDGAAYAPGEDTWRRLPAAPLPAGVPVGAVWSGSEVVVVGSRARTAPGSELVRAAAYDPAADRWRTLPDAPEPVNVGNVAWTGSELVVLGVRRDEQNRTSAHPLGATPTVMALDPDAGSWEVLASPELDQTSFWLAEAGGSLYAWHATGEVLSRPAGSGGATPWQPVAPASLDLKACEVDGAAAGDRVLIATTRCRTGARLDPATGRWQAIRVPPHRIPPIPTPFGMAVFTRTGAWLLPPP